MARIAYSDWLDRMDWLLITTVGRRTNSFEGIFWLYLYARGCTPGEVLDALVESWRDVGVIEEMLNA